MQLLHTKVPAVVYRTPQPAPADDPQQSRLERLRSRGILRVGYLPDNLPFAYFNAANDLVGFDVEMAHTLARDIGVKLAFVPVARDRMAEQLQAGDYDIIMSGVVATPQRAFTMAFSASYLDEPLALIVKDHRRDEFAATVEAVLAQRLVREQRDDRQQQERKGERRSSEDGQRSQRPPHRYFFGCLIFGGFFAAGFTSGRKPNFSICAWPALLSTLLMNACASVLFGLRLTTAIA